MEVFPNMRKTLFSLVFALLVFALPAYAQHGNNGGHQNGRTQAAPRHDTQGRGVMRDDHINGKQADKQFHAQHGSVGYHRGIAVGEARAHWNGRHFDHEFFESHWGYNHRFFWGHCGWYGPRWGLGSYFWYDGLYFEIVDTIPYDWYNAEVAIIYDPACDCYFAVNPVQPGLRIHVGVRF
jgi:hypothetical protein